MRTGSDPAAKQHNVRRVCKSQSFFGFYGDAVHRRYGFCRRRKDTAPKAVINTVEHRKGNKRVDLVKAIKYDKGYPHLRDPKASSAPSLNRLYPARPRSCDGDWYGSNHR